MSDQTTKPKGTVKAKIVGKEVMDGLRKYMNENNEKYVHLHTVCIGENKDGPLVYTDYTFKIDGVNDSRSIVVRDVNQANDKKPLEIEFIKPNFAIIVIHNPLSDQWTNLFTNNVLAELVKAKAEDTIKDLLANPERLRELTFGPDMLRT